MIFVKIVVRKNIVCIVYCIIIFLGYFIWGVKILFLKIKIFYEMIIFIEDVIKIYVFKLFLCNVYYMGY